jgi:hypothetical protein
MLGREILILYLPSPVSSLPTGPNGLLSLEPLPVLLSYTPSATYTSWRPRLWFSAPSYAKLIINILTSASLKKIWSEPDIFTSLFKVGKRGKPRHDSGFKSYYCSQSVKCRAKVFLLRKELCTQLVYRVYCALWIYPLSAVYCVFSAVFTEYCILPALCTLPSSKNDSKGSMSITSKWQCTCVRYDHGDLSNPAGLIRE